MESNLYKEDDYVKFISEIINTSLKNDKQSVELLLIINLGKLNKDFSDILVKWIRETLSKSSEDKALMVMAAIAIFSEIITDFSQGNMEINREIAINSCEAVLSFLNDSTFLKNRNLDEIEEYLKIPTQAILANAYLYRISGNRTENLEKAIFLAEKSFQGYSRENTPEQWASTNRTLGLAYNQRTLGSKPENIEKSIFYNKNALQIYTYNCSPTEWAKIQNNLALAYYQRIEGDNKENFEMSIEYCKKALLVHTRENHLTSWAKTTINLANIYKNNEEGDKLENLDKAIMYYQDVLKFINPEEMPEEWAKAQANLGSAYKQKTTANDSRKLNREKNVDFLIDAASFLSLKTFDDIFKIPQPLLEAVTNAVIVDNLWTDSIDDIDNTKIEQLEKAIQCYEKVFQVSTHTIFPEEWAELYITLGETYKHKDKIFDAIKCLSLALKFYNPIAFIQESLKIGRLLGNLAFAHDLLIEAIQGYTSAIQALEQLRITVTSDLYRQKILEIFSHIYQNIVQAYINTGQIDKAFEYSERLRSRILVDLMASNNLSQSENISLKVQDLLQQYEELQKLIDVERQEYKSENNRSETRAAWQAYNEKIAALEADKQQIWERLRREDPVLAGEIQVSPLNLSEIQQLIDNPNTAILSFYTTEHDTHIFILRKDQISLHTCAEQGLEMFQNWIYQNWLLPYINNPKQWEIQLETVLRELSERLQLPEIIDRHLQGIDELIIEPHLWLHQIPFAALPIGYQEYLVDRFLIRYTPSCQILDFCHQRPNIDIQGLKYGTIEDATDNLQFARFEGEQIAKMYNIPAEKRLIGSSQATRKNYRQLAEQVQVLHSCHHAQSRLDNPLESELILGDGNITLGQLMSPGWRLPNLLDVFLSCCETNLVTPVLTDDILTLSTGFLCAGARSVVSSLWSVNDLATAFFSIFYYEQRQLNKNRPEALKQAQIKLRELRKTDLEEISQQVSNLRKQARNLRKEYSPDSENYLECDRQYKKYAAISIAIDKIQKSKGEFPFAHPYYWADFICQGLR
jgi:CHAT domain-containing protein/TPR repeat protein